MSTFVYAPGLKVYIESYKLKQIVDVSGDLTGSQMQRRSDGVSQFQFGLTNALRKYDGVFTPNDRIVVAMKRLTWMRTFTGYLNSVPLFSSWPRDVSLSASCSLKRLQYFFWDPTLAASQELVRNSLRIQTDGSAPDGGIKQVVINLLEEVVDWSGAAAAKDKTLAGTKVHIASIPTHWFDAAAKIYQGVAENVEQEALLAAQLLASLGGGATMGGSAPTGAGTLPQGVANLDDKQRGWAEKVIAAAFADGASIRDAEYCIGCCLQESTLYMHASKKYAESKQIPHDRIGNDHDSVGLYQQRPSQGWGTVAQCMEVGHSTRKFLEVLRTIKKRDSLPFTTVIQTVQRSAYPNAYAKWEGQAKEIVAAYLASQSTLGGDPAFQNNAAGGGAGPTGPSATTGPMSPNQADRRAANALPQQGTTTAEQIVQVAQQLVTTRPNLRYVYGSTTAPDDPAPSSHDCSSFTRWVYYQSLGTLNGMPRTSHEQYKWAISRGGREISIEDGERTPGALLFRGWNEGRIHHVEFSLGTGGRSIGAHSASSNPQVGESRYRLGYYDKAVLLPAVVYPNTPGVVAATGDPNGVGDAGSGNLGNAYIQASLDARLDLSQRIQQATALESLFGSVPWEAAQQADSGLSESLVGIRALSNDTPILPYIANLMNSTMRQFCSAPNGDFIGWFPDYYGIWGTAAKMVLQPIEVRDFTVDWSDEYFVTHQYVSQTNDGGQQIDLASGEVSAISVLNRTVSFGIATIDQPGIMAPLFGLDQTPDETLRFTKFMYDRFGPRPNYSQIPGVTGGAGEFFMALFLFMQNWTMQYNANIEVTFMPEVYPGMIIQFPEYNFQAYVNTVIHNVSFGPGGGFKTTINIQAPARIKDTGGEDRMLGLPVAAFGGKTIKPGNQKSSASKSTKKAQTTPVNPRLARLE